METFSWDTVVVAAHPGATGVIIYGHKVELHVQEVVIASEQIPSIYGT